MVVCLLSHAVEIHAMRFDLKFTDIYLFLLMVSFVLYQKVHICILIALKNNDRQWEKPHLHCLCLKAAVLYARLYGIDDIMHTLMAFIISMQSINFTLAAPPSWMCQR